MSGAQDLSRGEGSSKENMSVIPIRSTTDSKVPDISDEVATEEQGSKWPQYVATIIVTFAHFTSGYSLGWTSPALPMLRRGETPVLTVEQAGWVGSLFCVGSVLGTPVGGILADRLGRKWTAVAATLPSFISWTIITSLGTTPAPYTLYIARVAAGMSTGILTVVLPMYIAETAQPSIRGALGSLVIVSFNLGLLAVYAAGTILPYVPLALLGFLPVVVFLIGSTWLPESPVLLVARGRISEARCSLQKLRGSGCDVSLELEHTQAAAEQEAEIAAHDESASLWSLVRKSRGVRRGLGLTLGLMTGQQLCGIAAILLYTADIFNESGAEMDPNSAAVIVGALQLIFNSSSSLLLDRVGRRPLLIGSGALMALSLVTLGVYFEIRHAGVDVEAISWLPVLALSLYVVFNAGGVGPVPWVLLGEVFPARVRSAASGFVAMWVWGLAFVVTLVFPPLLAAIQLSGAVWLFSAGCVALTIFAILFCPETKGRTLDHIISELDRRD